jgi:5'-deoxynucleotidase YfbR-like HD superfamily hydrolase
MLMMADYVYEGNIPHELVRAILYHDAPEVLIGDIPAPAKKMPIIADAFKQMEQEAAQALGVEIYLQPQHAVMLKVLDSLEFNYFVAHEQALGNRLLEEQGARSAEYIESALLQIEDPYLQRRIVHLREHIKV